MSCYNIPSGNSRKHKVLMDWMSGNSTQPAGKLVSFKSPCAAVDHGRDGGQLFPSCTLGVQSRVGRTKKARVKTPLPPLLIDLVSLYDFHRSFSLKNDFWFEKPLNQITPKVPASPDIPGFHEQTMGKNGWVDDQTMGFWLWVSDVEYPGREEHMEQ
jgi:hypothetical protein